MIKEDYIKITNRELKEKVSKKIMIKQIENYYEIENTIENIKHNYNIGDDVFLKKGTLLHGTYKNIEGLKEIVNNGLIAGFFIGGRNSKYPCCVGVWNLQKDYLLKDYINFYSGGTIKFAGPNKQEIAVISYDDMPNILDIISFKDQYHKWNLEQTKEARFMPSLVQNNIQIGIIINGQSKEIKKLLEGDILTDKINDKDVKEFVNPKYYEYFVIDKKNKDAFFTDRESAVLFGIPSCFIEGVLVGKSYEQDKKMLKEIKKLLPKAYICNLKGKVIEV